MKCVIVAAGTSSRLRPLTDRLPKCLLKVGGKTILERTVSPLLEQGISRIAFVVGFEAGQIRAYLNDRYPGYEFTFVLNEQFATTNNAFSLFKAREFFLSSQSSQEITENLLILDSDIVFHPGLLNALSHPRDANRIAVRVKGEHDAEEIGVSVDNHGHVTKIGKHLDKKGIYGESIGIELFSHDTGELLFKVLERRIREGKGRMEYYESAFQEMIDLGTTIDAVDVSDFPSIEIDVPADVEHAERVIIPAIDGH